LENEKLEIEKLLIDDFEVIPYIYGEEIEEDKGNGLRIKAIVETSNDNWLKIKKMWHNGEYYLVTRLGISNAVKEMRFGRVIWSQNENKIKIEMYLFDKIYDENDSWSVFGDILQPQVNNIEIKLLENLKTIDNLLALLLEKGIITNEEKENVMLIDNEKLDFLEFFEVGDLDKYLKDKD
jgi:hypothetical protein